MYLSIYLSIHTYIHACMHAYIHMYIYIYRDIDRYIDRSRCATSPPTQCRSGRSAATTRRQIYINTNNNIKLCNQ